MVQAQARVLRVVAEEATLAPSSMTKCREVYLICALGKERRRCAVARNITSPAWHQVFELPLPSDESGLYLTAMLYGRSPTCIDQMLGQCEIDLKQALAATQPRRQSFLFCAPQDASAPHEVVLQLSIVEPTASVTHHIFEHQRWAPSSDNWSSDHLSSLLGDRAPFESKQRHGDTFQEALPGALKEPPIAEDGPWTFLVSGADGDGWRYGTSCNGPWHAEMSTSRVVRCREWHKTFYYRKTSIVEEH